MPSDELEQQDAAAAGELEQPDAAAAAELQRLFHPRTGLYPVAALLADEEGPLTDAERARIRALCRCGHGPAAHPAADARCDAPRCPCTRYSRVAQGSPVNRATR